MFLHIWIERLFFEQNYIFSYTDFLPKNPKKPNTEPKPKPKNTKPKPKKTQKTSPKPKNPNTKPKPKPKPKPKNPKKPNTKPKNLKKQIPKKLKRNRLYLYKNKLSKYYYYTVSKQVPFSRNQSCPDLQISCR